MQTSGGLLLYGLLFFFCCCTVRGNRYLPQEAINFTKCDPVLNECPANSSCDITNNGYYCGCHSNFYNIKHKMTITYPGGECTEYCGEKGKNFPCACRRGFVATLDGNRLYKCTDKCKNNWECPSGATCTRGYCYCKVCKPQGKNCVTLVKLDDVCTVPSTTTTPVPTTTTPVPTTTTPVPTTTTPVPTTTPVLTTPQEIKFLPDEAAHFPQCDPSLKQCPASSSCQITTNGSYYCACDLDFYNVEDRLNITYPGGECIELCREKENAFPCACRRGFVLIVNANGRYTCTDKCRYDSDCPSEASCKEENCYCEVCKSQGNNCIIFVKLDDVCPAKPMIKITDHPQTRAVAPRPGTYFLPDEAVHFTQCHPSLKQCPDNSICVETNKGYHCACDSGFYNVKDKLPITYPGGKCTDKCRNDLDCPSGASCKQRGNCHCKICKPQGKSCITFVKLDEVCAGFRFLPQEAIHFTQCNPSLNGCPANSYCEVTNRGYYCACDSGYYNVKDKMTITYPGGECTEYCRDRENDSPCVCKNGYVLRLNENGLYTCTALSTTIGGAADDPQPGSVTPRPGICILPPEAAHFTQCDPSLNECPDNSGCERTNRGYYCGCHMDFYNIKDKLTFTYPGGECLELCGMTGKLFTCACRRGFVSMLNENGLYVCIANHRCNTDF